MKRKAPRADTLKILYALSGNTCAYPHCDHPIFNDKGLYVAQLCHIEAAQKRGPRFNAAQTEDERNSHSNLLFMCHRHHKETDDVIEFTVERVKEIKAIHESGFTEQGKNATNEMIHQILAEAISFWNRQRQKGFELQKLKIKRNFDLNIIQLFNELNVRVQAIQAYCDVCAKSDSDEVLQEDLKQLCEKLDIDFLKFSSIPYYKNPLINRNWEMHNIGRPNFFSHIALCIAQLRVKVLEELLKNNPKDKKINQLVVRARRGFDDNFDQSYYVD